MRKLSQLKVGDVIQIVTRESGMFSSQHYFEGVKPKQIKRTYTSCNYLPNFHAIITPFLLRIIWVIQVQL